MDEPRASFHARVTGRVQGVGFRFFVQRCAHALGLSGMVRNLSTGEVEIEAQGERSALEELVQQVRRGPRGSRVDNVEVRWGEDHGGSGGFRIGH